MECVRQFPPQGQEVEEVEGVLEVCVWGSSGREEKSNQIHMGPLLAVECGSYSGIRGRGQERQEMGTMPR